MKKLIFLIISIISNIPSFAQTTLNEEIWNLLPLAEELPDNEWNIYGENGDSLHLYVFVEQFDESVDPMLYLSNDSVDISRYSAKDKMGNIITQAKELAEQIKQQKRQVNETYDKIMATLHRISKMAYTQNHWERHKGGKDEILWTMKLKEGDAEIKFKLLPLDGTAEHPELLWLLPKSSGCVEVVCKLAEPAWHYDERKEHYMKIILEQ